MVAEVSIAVFCLKTVRYTLYMWLPMYLLQQVWPMICHLNSFQHSFDFFIEIKLNYSKTNSGLFSTMFEIGGILGSASNGFVLKR
jgi:OPA family glycerol-3-phosphate transporter-like MFS transporter 1/2